MNFTRIVIPGRTNPVTILHTEPLDSGDYRLTLNAGSGVYERTVTRRGMLAIDCEVLSIPTFAESEAA